MKRDLDLIRDILLTIENSTNKISIYELSDTLNVSPDIIFYQITLLREANFIIAHGGIRVITPTSRRYESFRVYRLTFTGHDYLDAIRDNRVWAATKSELSKIGGSAAFDIVKELGLRFVSQYLTQI